MQLSLPPGWNSDIVPCIAIALEKFYPRRQMWCSDKVGMRLMNNGKNDSQTPVQTEQYQRAHNIYIYTCDYITRKQILIRNEFRVHSHHSVCVCVCLRVFLNSCPLRRVAGNVSIAH